ncbi:dTDP-4-dehydrorhamnose reductase [Orrella sp. JC864]
MTSLPTFLLIGKTGQLGFELQRSLAVLGNVVALGRQDADLSRPDSLRAVVRRVQPDVIVNAAAYTAVDKAEDEAELAQLVNGKAPGVLAEEAAALNALMVHYSTDYVFDGRKQGLYSETDPTNPLSSYGRSKLAGEIEVRSVCPRHLIFRTSWVFGAHGANFLKTALRLVQQRDSLKIVADQHGAPTAASLIADITAQVSSRFLANRHAVTDFPFGTYHLAADGETTWHGYALMVATLAQQAGLRLKVAPQAIEAIPTSAYPLPAQRPFNSRLDTRKLRESFHLHLPSWETGVRQVFALITAA